MSWTGELLALFKLRGIVRTTQVYEAGIPTIYLTRLLRSGDIVRTSAATYVRAGRDLTEDAILADIAETMSRGIASLETAAAHFGLADHPKNRASVSFPPGHGPPLRRAFEVEAFREGRGIHGVGALERCVGPASDRTHVRIYGPSKTVADFFKFRRRVGIDRALAVLHAYRASEHWDPDALDRYAALDRVQRVMEPYLAALHAWHELDADTTDPKALTRSERTAAAGAGPRSGASPRIP